MVLSRNGDFNVFAKNGVSTVSAKETEFWSYLMDIPAALECLCLQDCQLGLEFPRDNNMEMIILHGFRRIEKRRTGAPIGPAKPGSPGSP